MSHSRNGDDASPKSRRMKSMAHGKTTSKPVASKASKVLSNPRSSKSVKSVAGSALSQKHGGGKKK